MTSSFQIPATRDPSMTPNLAYQMPRLQEIREAYMELADRAYRQECFDIAEKMYIAAWEEVNQNTATETELGIVLSQLGKFFFERGLHKKSQILLRRSLDTFDRNKEPLRQATIENLELLAHIASAEGKFLQAEKFFKRQWLLSKRLFEKNDPRIMEPIKSLVQLNLKYGRYERADALARRLRATKA